MVQEEANSDILRKDVAGQDCRNKRARLLKVVPREEISDRCGRTKRSKKLRVDLFYKFEACYLRQVVELDRGTVGWFKEARRRSSKAREYGPSATAV